MYRNVFLLWLIMQSTISLGQEKSKTYPEAKPLGFIIPEGFDKVSIPFQIYNNLIVIDVLLNRSLPLKFVLDTGVRTTVLTEKTLTDLLNLEYTRKITIPGAGGEKLVDAFVVNNVSLNIGQIEGRGHALLVLEDDLLQLKNFLGVNVHGILGYELFSRFVVDLNYDKRIITFHNPDSFNKRKKFIELPITIEDTKPYIYANFIIRGSEPAKGKFMLDTGASHTMLLDTRSSEDVYVPDPSITSTIGRGLGGNIYGRIARVDKMWVDNYSFNKIIATFPDPASYEISLENNFRNGTFGGGMMSRFHIIFDYVNSRIYVRKGSGFKTPFEFNLSGLTIKAKGYYLRNYEIDNVRKNSAAEAAGLEVGDEILRVNGIKTATLNLDEVIGKLNSKANKRIRMLILRDGQPMNIEYRLVRLI